MRTGWTLTVFRKLETPPPPPKFGPDTPLPKNWTRPPQIWSRPPRKIGADPPEKLEQTPPRKIGADTPRKIGADTPPPCEQNHTRLWKYNLGQNFVSAGNNSWADRANSLIVETGSIGILGNLLEIWFKQMLSTVSVCWCCPSGTQLSSCS